MPPTKQGLPQQRLFQKVTLAADENLGGNNRFHSSGRPVRTTGQGVHLQESSGTIRQMIRSLKEPYRECVSCFLEEKDTQEIAQLLGRPKKDGGNPVVPHKTILQKQIKEVYSYENNDASSLLQNSPGFSPRTAHPDRPNLFTAAVEQLDQLEVWRYPSIFPFVTSAWTVTPLCFAERFLWTTRASSCHRKNPPFPSRQPTI